MIDEQPFNLVLPAFDVFRQEEYNISSGCKEGLTNPLRPDIGCIDGSKWDL
jgi:hypothetical protein